MDTRRVEIANVRERATELELVREPPGRRRNRVADAGQPLERSDRVATAERLGFERDRGIAGVLGPVFTALQEVERGVVPCSARCLPCTLQTRCGRLDDVLVRRLGHGG
jgi:hypothetical protein